MHVATIWNIKFWKWNILYPNFISVENMAIVGFWFFRSNGFKSHSSSWNGLSRLRASEWRCGGGGGGGEIKVLSSDILFGLLNKWFEIAAAKWYVRFDISIGPKWFKSDFSKAWISEHLYVDTLYFPVGLWSINLLPACNGDNKSSFKNWHIYKSCYFIDVPDKLLKKLWIVDNFDVVFSI